MVRTLTNPMLDPRCSWTAGWRRADIGAANGHGNARSVARVQSVVACGGEVDGVRLLSPQTIARIFEVQVDGADLVLGLPLTLGLGYGLPNPALAPFVPKGRIAYWGGWGGSLVLADAERRMCFAYIMNRMGPDLVGGPNVASLVAATYAVLARSRISS
jgi:CubicO group peptidase (beta-lactamase class C family)